MTRRIALLTTLFCMLSLAGRPGQAAPLPTGACCNLIGGCCPPAENCADATTQSFCDFGTWHQGMTCDELCPTTTTTLPTGACCQVEGPCVEVTPTACDLVGLYQGDGTQCQTVECPLPTTTTTTSLPTTSTTTTTTTVTTVSSTTTTLPLVVICGDANFDENITAADALLTLKAAVGTRKCSLRVCDYNGSTDLTAPDALLILRVAVGQVVVPMCPLV